MGNESITARRVMMKWAKTLSTAALLLLAVSVPVVAQTGRITGTVADSVTGQPVIGAAVSVVGTNRVVGTTGTGQFTLTNVPTGARQVTVQVIGYAPSTKTV